MTNKDKKPGLKKPVVKSNRKFACEYKIPYPVLKICEFLEDRDKGKYPQPAILEWIERSLRTWYDSKGTKRLDEIMGLKSLKPGGSPPFKKAILAQRNNSLLRDMAILVAFGFKKHEAAKAVSAKLAASNFRDPEWGTSPNISWESLADLYENWLEREYTEEYYNQGRHNQGYLSTFPSETIPERFKKGRE
jgi:hypothetical protein